MEFVIATVLIAIIAIVTILNLLIHKSKSGILINKIPGPPILPLLGNTIDALVPLEELWAIFRKNAEDYYSIYRMWIFHWPIVCIRHPDDAEILLSSQKNITKSIFHDLLRPWLNEGLLTSDGSKWRHRRKMLTPAFHFNVLEDFVGSMVENSERLVKSLKDEDGEIVKDVGPLLAKFSLSVICETAMGTRLHNHNSDQDKYINAVRKFGEIMFHRAQRPWLKSDFIFALTPMGRELAAELKILHDFTTEIIQNRKRFHDETGGRYLKVFSTQNETAPESSVPSYDAPTKKKRLAMLDLLIAVQREQGTIDDLGIREEVDTFIFEGHDTTHSGMCFALLLLAENKEIQARARAEVDSVLKESNGKLGLSEFRNMTYLERCIKESLRLFPAVWNVTRNITENLKLSKYVLPSGTTTFVQIYDVHRDPNFWPQPEVFDPDRFLPERMEGRHPFSYIPFSAGPRNCIGQKFAMLEMKAFIGQILHNFYLEPMVLTSAVHLIPDLVLASSHPLRVKFVPIRR